MNIFDKKRNVTFYMKLLYPEGYSLYNLTEEQKKDKEFLEKYLD